MIATCDIFDYRPIPQFIFVETAFSIRFTMRSACDAFGTVQRSDPRAARRGAVLASVILGRRRPALARRDDNWALQGDYWSRLQRTAYLISTPRPLPVSPSSTACGTAKCRRYFASDC